MTRIIDAISSQRLEEAKSLIIEYQNFLGVDLCFQNFDQEINKLEEYYAVPGRLFLGVDDDDNAVGCIGFHPVNDATTQIAELKRLYVQPASRSTGLGGQLVDAAISAARREGFKSICLDTLPTLETAIRMYRRLGFVDIEPYNNNPVAGVMWLSKTLD